MNTEECPEPVYGLVHCLCLATIFLGTISHLGWAQTWTEDSFADFATGHLDAAGQNIYVCHDGTIRTIHRFDLNQDGYLDLIFNSTHNSHDFIPATLCTATSGQKIEQAQLAVEGSRASAVADLNRDGHLDVVFCPSGNGTYSPRNLLTIIWGGDDGWPAQRSNGFLPVYNARRVQVADLNRDDWPDVVVFNEHEAWIPGQPDGRIIRIFWGSKQGFSLERRKDVGVPEAIDLAAGDFDNDGARDAAVLKENGKIHIIWATASEGSGMELAETEITLPGQGSQCLTAADCDGDGQIDLVVGTNQLVVYISHGKTGRSWKQATAVPAFDASHVAVGNLDDDQFSDLVLTNLVIRRAAGGEVGGAEESAVPEINILWGGADGFKKTRHLALEIDHASATAIGDLDGDSHPDLAVAVYQTNTDYAAESLVFFGTGGRCLQRAKEGCCTKGATDVVIAPPNGVFPARAVFCNSFGGTAYERVPLLVYWGDQEGFAADRRWEIPFASGYEASAADLNADGFVDLLALSSGHLGTKLAHTVSELGANIFWGGADGFDLEKRRTVLRHFGLWTSNVADLDRDGYLDLVLGAFEHPKVPIANVEIYYGSKEGFGDQRHASLPCGQRSGGCLIADLNRDHWLDIVSCSYPDSLAWIYWGGPEGFDINRREQFEVTAPIEFEAADLNGDGYLDLIAGCFWDPIARVHDLGTMIFWGSPEGTYKQSNAQKLPGLAVVGLTVADFDGDGYLDLFCPHYQAGEGSIRSSVPCYLYWGSREGFRSRNKTQLICDGGADALAGDFNHDGLIDLAVANHARNGDHRVDSKVFYNDGNRFANPRIERLPTTGTHWMYLQDMGHIYDRKWRQTYESSLFEWQQEVSSGKLDYKADVPAGTQLEFAVRSAQGEDLLDRQPWLPVSSGEFSLESGDRCLQYRAVFKSDNGDRYPILDRVRIDLR
ncbi:MAG: FG-GAP-like repeat-containing protein [Pirellulaceae bacterium]